MQALAIILLHLTATVLPHHTAPILGIRCTGDLDGFGACIERVADLDGDGVEDLAIGDPNPDAEDHDSGNVWIISGGKHSLILRLRGAQGSAQGSASDKWFGQSVAYLPDSSLDPKGLFVVSSTTNFPDLSISEHENSKDSGRIYVLKSDGSLHKLLTGDEKSRRFGLRVRCAGDIDGDKESDLLVCAPARERDGGPGAVDIYSGKTLSKLLEVTGYGGDSQFGENAIVTCPVVADGARILACSAGLDVGARTRSVVLYRLARNGNKLEAKQLCSIRGRPKETTFGYALADVGDINGDGWPDLAISAPELGSMRTSEDPPDAVHPRGRVIIVSSANGDILREVTLLDKSGQFGADVCASEGRAWGGKKTLLVSCLQNPGSTAGHTSFCVYALDTGAFVERIDDRGGSSLLVLRGAGHERIVTSKCDCDPEGLPGAVRISGADDRNFGTVIRRSDLVSKPKEH